MLVGRFLRDRPGPGPGREPGARRSTSPPSGGTLPRRRRRPSSLLLVGTVLIVGALTFLPGAGAGADRRALPR
ncbi:MAG: hypothetical protein MZW92_10515 [Comamonadaceae bacterium]|nr:hypothetical protein [Comamonadaceae bacterium]